MIARPHSPAASHSLSRSGGLSLPTSATVKATVLALLFLFAGASSGWASKLKRADDGCDPVSNQLIVGYKKSADTGDQKELLKEKKAKRVESLEGVDEVALHEMDLVKVKGSLDGAIKSLERDSDVAYAEKNCRLELSRTPNDPFFAPLLWGLNNTGQDIEGVIGTPDADIDAPEAWEMSTGSNQIVVGITDSGVDYNHEDLKENIWTNLGETPGNGKDDDGNGFVDDTRGWDFSGSDRDPMDGHSHGTHVAGTIGAVGDNGIGVTGVNWRVRLMPVKVFTDDGRGNKADVIAGFAYAAANGAQVVNASLGGPAFSQAQQDVIDGASDKTLFVVAAGNESQNVDQTPSYPCSYQSANIICVAATDQNDKLAFFSNFGTKNVDIAAPGVNILSTTPGNKYGFKSGTSMATPHVAGAAALMFAFQGGSTPKQIKALMLSSVFDDLPSLEGAVDGRRRLGLPKQKPPEKVQPPPKKPTPGEPAPEPNPPPDRPDLPDPALPDAPDPDVDYYTPIGGSRVVVIVIGLYTEVPTIPSLDGTIGNVNRSYVQNVIASLKFKRGKSCWYLTDDARVPWLKHSCGDDLYIPMGTDAGAGTVSLPLTPAQRSGLCRGTYTLTTRLITTSGESIVIGRKKLAIKKNGKNKRCKSKKKKKRR